MKFYFLFALTILTSKLIIAQDELGSDSSEVHKSWIIKVRYFPSSYITTAGLGVEKQLGRHFSVLVSINAIRYFPVGKSLFRGSAISLKPELRYHFYKKSDEVFFVSSFSEFGDHSLPTNKRKANMKKHGQNEGGSFFGIGILLGRNIAITRKFHVDLYAGPKHRWQTETIYNSNVESHTRIRPYWGLRMGLNLNYTFT